jgi:S-adenosylmethionine:tRNA ribosyltransferase-isomerase
MKTEVFDYHLPDELIAQEPSGVRDTSRLMVVGRAGSTVSHCVFKDLPKLLDPGDCLVVNSSRVFPGRLKGRKEGSGGRAEIILLERVGPGLWRALAGGAALRPGVRLRFDGSLTGEVVEGPLAGKALIRFDSAAVEGDIDELVFRTGDVPLPPYIKKELSDPERYQTVYGEREISAAAPTAGLHFTDGLLDEIRSRGIIVERLELAVGLDTFLPVREARIEDHRIHSEWFSIGAECARGVNEARDRGSRVVAVGTTAVRALESAADARGRLTPRSGYTDLFVAPGFGFKAVDALVTNFHFPRSTLLMLVCAFGGTGLILEAYRQAVRERYRFYSFGDAMLVI